ncbi:MAG: amidohydrolase family protein [Patescibacteria group bacterium]
MNYKFLIKNTTAFVGESFKREDAVDILIDGDSIKKIGRNLKIAKAKIIDGQKFFVTPGFINAHFHPGQQINRGLCLGLNQDEEMDFLHATEKIRDSEMGYWLSAVAILEGLKSGTTCFQSVGSEIELQARLYNQLKIRAICVLMPKDIVATDKKIIIRARTWETEERLRRAEEMHQKYHNDLARVHFGVTNVRYASDKLILGMQALAEKYDTYFHMHAAEGKLYVKKVLERTGDRPIEHLHKINALNHRVSMAHMTQLTPKEISYVAKSHSHVVHCPRSNSYLGVGVCPVYDLRKAGVNVALGTDAAINNNSNEVRGEASAAFHKISDQTGNPAVINYLDLFKMLTTSAGTAVGLDKQIGAIKEGKKADLVLWSKNDFSFIPGHNYLADLIFTYSCQAHTVFINGVKVLANYKSLTINEQEVKTEAKRLSKKYYQLFNNKIAGRLPR